MSIPQNLQVVLILVGGGHRVAKIMKLHHDMQQLNIFTANFATFKVSSVSHTHSQHCTLSNNNILVLSKYFHVVE
jgi:hypothetical protein